MEFEGTTIVGVLRDGKCALAGDGQVTMGQSVVMKKGAVKVRRIYHDSVVMGFAGSVADAFALSELFEGKLEQYSGNLYRAAVELAQLWRSDKVLRKLEAMMIVADKSGMLVLGLVMGALTSITLKALLPALGKMGFSTQEKRGE